MNKKFYQRMNATAWLCKAIAMSAIARKVFCLFILLGTMSIGSYAQLVVNQLFTDNAVIQQGQPIRVWGTDTPGNTVTVTIDGQEGTSFVSTDGDWMMEIPNTLVTGTAASPPTYSMTISSESGSLTFNNLVSGDVWVASGQSNMEWNFATIESNGPGGYGALPANMEEVKTDVFPNFRILDVQTLQSAEEERMLTVVANTDKNRWYQMTDYTRISKQSAVGYYVGRTLHQNLDYPIGIIVSAVGGTFIEEWTSQQAEDAVAALGFLPDPNSSTNGRLPQQRFNAMISPLIPASVSGVVWYQGESNGGSAPGYAEKTLACFNDWQNRWGQKLPVYTTMLAGFVNYGPGGTIQGGNSGYIRSEQLMAADAYAEDSIYLISAHDLGVEENIHPDRKKEVGERHAAQILHHMDSQTYPQLFYPRVTNCVINGSEAIFTLDQPVDQSTLVQGMFQAFRGWQDEIPATATYIDPTHVRLVTDNLETMVLAEYNHGPWANDHLTLTHPSNPAPYPALGALPTHGYSTWFQPTQTYNYNYSGTQYQFTSSFDAGVSAPTLVIDTVSTSPMTISYNNVSPPDASGAELKVFNNIQGRSPSDHYNVRVKFSSEDETAWRDAFVLQTTARSDASVYESLWNWTASWATFESDFNGDVVEVEISKKDGSPITQAMVRPVGDASAATISNGKAYLTFSEPANVNIDIDGQMENNYTGMSEWGGPYSGSPVHTISIFGNPTYPEPNVADPQVIELNPGETIPTDRSTWHTIYFKPGVHDIGNAWQIQDDETLYIPGDAVVHGTIHPVGSETNLQWGSAASERFKVYGSGAISGENNVWAGDGVYENKTFTYTASDAVLEGFVVIDPANHTFNMNESYGNGAHQNTYKNLKILAWRKNSDGINAFRHSVVTDCFFRVQDDAFYFGQHNVIQQNNVVWNDANGAVLFLDGNNKDGSQSIFSDTKVIYHRAHWHYWKTGGRIISMRQTTNQDTINNVHVKNITVEDPLPAFPPFYGEITDPNATEAYFNNIVFENIVQYHDGVVRDGDGTTPGPDTNQGGKPQNTLIGQPGILWENIHFKNCEFNGVTLTSFQDGNFDYSNVDENTVIFSAGSAVGGVTIDNCTASIPVGGTVNLNATVNPVDAANKSVIWSSSNDLIATVDENGVVAANNVGSVDITVTTQDGGFTDVCTINVEALTDGISIVSWPAQIAPGQTIDVVVDFTASELLEINAFIQLNSDPWTNYGSTVVSAPQGSTQGLTIPVTAPASPDANFFGTGVLKVVASLRPVGGTWATKRAFDQQTGIDGLNSMVSVTGVTIDNCPSTAMSIGSTYDLNETVSPVDATDKSVSWSSSNTLVASVDQNGLVEAQGAGSADITVTTTDGAFTAVCTITVDPLPNTINLVSWPAVVSQGETIEVQVDYSSNQSDYIIRAFIQENGGDFSEHGSSSEIFVGQGTDTNFPITFTVDSNIPLGVDLYKIVVSLQSPSGAFGEGASDQEIDVDAVSSVSSMSVQSITEGTQNAGQGNKFGVANVLVQDDMGNPVANATVTGNFTGEYNESGSVITGSDGIASIVTTGTAKGNVNFNFCVTNISHGTLTYASANNVVTCSNDPGARLAIEKQLSGSNISLKLFPNPVDQILNFEFDEEEMRNISFYDMTGKLIHSFMTSEKAYRINMEALKVSGALIVKIKSHDSISNHRILVR